MFRVSVEDAPAELRAAILAMKRADSEVRRDVSARMRETMNPVWKSELSQHLSGAGTMEGRMITPGARIAGGNPGQLVAGASKRKIGSGGGLVPNDRWQNYEYGSNRDKLSDVTSPKGKKFQRHTQRHLPGYVKAGRVIGPTVAELLPRIAAFWTQSVVRAFMDAADKRQ